MAKRQRKSGTKKKRQKKHRPKAQEEQAALGPAPMLASEEDYSGGAMQAMRGTMRSAVGQGEKDESKPSSWTDHIWTILLLIVLAAIVFWQFGQ